MIRRVARSLLVTGTVALSVIGAAAGAIHQDGILAARRTAPLTSIRSDVQTWLAANGFAGFQVAEVMAFTNNDYVAVTDKFGKPAFELLTSPGGGWLMEEPASMMWNTRYGMMRNRSTTLEPFPGMNMMWGGDMMGSPHAWFSSGSGAVHSVQQAVTVADTWLASAGRGTERAESDGRSFPGYFTLDTTRSGKTYGMLSVNARTGAVWYHGWHGSFRSERQFAG